MAVLDRYLRSNQAGTYENVFYAVDWGVNAFIKPALVCKLSAFPSPWCRNEDREDMLWQRQQQLWDREMQRWDAERLAWTQREAFLLQQIAKQQAALVRL